MSIDGSIVSAQASYKFHPVVRGELPAARSSSQIGSGLILKYRYVAAGHALSVVARANMASSRPTPTRRVSCFDDATYWHHNC